MNSAAPAVSVLLPVRDGERFLLQALESLEAQRGVAFEILVIDDASRDRTPALLAAFAAAHPRVRPLAGPGQGLSRALNLGLEQARGRYLARLDADDQALPGRLAAQFAFLERHPEIGVLGTQALGMDEHGTRLGRIRVPVGPRRVRQALEISAAVIHPTVMMRRQPVLEVGGYRPLFDGAEDYDLWLRLSGITALDNLPEPWVLCRRHASRVTARQALRQARRSALALLAHEARRQGRPDPLDQRQNFAGWREAFEVLVPQARDRRRALTAASLADNGGSLRRRGSALLQGACLRVSGGGDRPLRRRLALACVRHQLQLARARRWREALACLPNHLACGTFALPLAYLRQAAILWPSRLDFRSD